jgi:hypothetical protein
MSVNAETASLLPPPPPPLLLLPLLLPLLLAMPPFPPLPPLALLLHAPVLQTRTPSGTKCTRAKQRLAAEPRVTARSIGRTERTPRGAGGRVSVARQTDRT